MMSSHESREWVLKKSLSEPKRRYHFAKDPTRKPSKKESTICSFHSRSALPFDQAPEIATSEMA
jgi:hypothetical protein